MLRRRRRGRQAAGTAAAADSRRPGWRWRSCSCSASGWASTSPTRTSSTSATRASSAPSGSPTAGRCTAAIPADNEHGDTYGPFNYEAYVPFQQVFGWGGRWDDLPAAHGAAIFFDLLAVGTAVPARAAHARPDARDRPRLRLGLVPLHAVRAGEQRQRHARRRRWCWPHCWPPATLGLATAARGGLAALAGLTKLAPLALAPDPGHGRPAQLPGAGGRLDWRCSRPGLPAAGALAMLPALAHDSLHTIYERTFVYQGDRGSPFSAWGLYGWRGAELAWRVAAVRAGARRAGSPAQRHGRARRRLRRLILLAVHSRSNTGSTSTSPGSSRWRSWLCWGASVRAPAPAVAAASEPARSSRRAAAVLSS